MRVVNFRELIIFLCSHALSIFKSKSYATARRKMVPMNLLDWWLAATGSVCFGLSKTGIPGVGILGVALFARAFAVNSPGIALPLLIVADFVALGMYFRYAIWSKMLRMFPWAAIGIVIGFLLMRRIDPKELNRVIGWILLALVVLAVWWRWIRGPVSDTAAGDSHGMGYEIAVGILSGITTMIANAAGPIMILYLLRMRLPKMQFIGTCSCFFLVLNCFKVPFQIYQEQITLETFRTDLPFIPFSLLGALLGWVVIKHINQVLFESLCLILTFVSALKLVM